MTADAVKSMEAKRKRLRIVAALFLGFASSFALLLIITFASYIPMLADSLIDVKGVNVAEISAEFARATENVGTFWWWALFLFCGLFISWYLVWVMKD